MKKIVILCLIGFLSFITKAQTTAQSSDLNSGTIAEQFDYVIENSNKYQEFKVVKKAWLTQLKKHVIDSLKRQDIQVNQLNLILNEQVKRLTQQENSIDSLNQSIVTINTDKEHIQFLGANLNKGTFKTLFWSITGILLLLLAFFIYQFKNSHVVTKATQLRFSELEKEFEEHRRVALEREQKVMRKLQDEINKHK